MQENGLALKERGNGLVMTNQDGLMVKASSVARELSKGKLEDKFGTFAPSSDRQANAEGPKRSYEARPVRSRIDTTLLFAQVQNRTAGHVALIVPESGSLPAIIKTGGLKRLSVRRS